MVLPLHHHANRPAPSPSAACPQVFNTLWRAISHFIDPVTKQKVGVEERKQ